MHRIRSMTTRKPPQVACKCEGLEDRLLLSATAPTVTSISADNRGQAIIYFSQSINTATLSKSSVLEYTANSRGVYNVPVAVTYSYSRGALTVTGALRADTKYRVVLVDTIKGTDGVALNGTGGRRGGNFDVVTTATTLNAQFTTIAGVLDVALVDNSTLLPTLSNFLYYADHGLWDNTFFQRNGAYDAAPLGPLPIIQGGEYSIVRNTVTTIPTTTAIDEVTGLSNTFGTIAMARTASLTASETDQWFFNTADDTQLDAGQYTAFGTVAHRDLGILTELAAYPAEDSGSDLPVTDPSTIAARGGTLDPDTDLVIISRVAMVMTVETTPASAAVVITPSTASSTASSTAPLLEKVESSAPGFSQTLIASSIFGGDASVLQ